MSRGSIVVAALTASALVLVAAACGGGRAAPPSTTETTQTTGTVSAGFASAKNCRDLATIEAKVARAIVPRSPSAAMSLIANRAQLVRWANVAPAEIRGDFQTVATAFADLVHAIEKSGFLLDPPTSAQLAALIHAAKSLQTPQVKQAATHLQAWSNQNCH